MILQWLWGAQESMEIVKRTSSSGPLSSLGGPTLKAYSTQLVTWEDQTSPPPHDTVHHVSDQVPLFLKYSAHRHNLALASLSLEG